MQSARESAVIDVKVMLITISNSIGIRSFLSCRALCGILTHLLALSFASLLLADSSTWMSSGLQDTGLSAGAQPVAALSATGSIFLSISGACVAPSLTLGNPSQGASPSCVTRNTASGQPLFAVEMAGAVVGAMVLDASGNPYLAGSAGAGFATTPGAYEPNATGQSNPFVCKLSGTDGHPLFCTFVDVSVGCGSLVLDAAGDAYVAAFCGNSPTIGIEKLNPTGTGIIYNVNLNTSANRGPVLAVDANGNLYCLCNGLVELNAAGASIGTAIGLGSELPEALALDPSGNPEVLLEDSTNLSNCRVRKYSAGLSNILFDTLVYCGAGGPVVLAMAIDSSGIMDMIGGTTAINLPQVNPAQACSQPGDAAEEGVNVFLLRVDSAGNVLQSTYLQTLAESGDAGGSVEASMTVTTSGATAIFWSQGTDVSVMTLLPAGGTVAMTCVGNAASFVNMPLAPNEIVTVFGQNLGPGAPLTAQPGADGLYPFQLGGIEITFDGQAAPLMYVAGNQVNLVTPQALQGKTSTQVCAVVNSAIANCINMPVQPASPGIFSSGLVFSPQEPGGVINIPYAAALNQDGSINSAQNPAAVGSIVSLFVTGLGAMTPSPPDGGITPVPPAAQQLSIQVLFLPVNEENIAEPLEILYAGPAPLEIEGLGQINFRLPNAEVEESELNGGPALYQVYVIWPDGGSQSQLATVWTQ
jgi:uncharacterized protein (TIGR03437 family)